MRYSNPRCWTLSLFLVISFYSQGSIAASAESVDEIANTEEREAAKVLMKELDLFFKRGLDAYDRNRCQDANLYFDRYLSTLGESRTDKAPHDVKAIRAAVEWCKSYLEITKTSFKFSGLYGSKEFKKLMRNKPRVN